MKVNPGASPPENNPGGSPSGVPSREANLAGEVLKRPLEAEGDAAQRLKARAKILGTEQETEVGEDIPIPGRTTLISRPSS